MSDFLDILAQDAKKTVESGYYQVKTLNHQRSRLTDKIITDQGNPIIAEIKLSSPSHPIVNRKIDVSEVASSMMRGGAVGISVVTEPKHFKGSLDNFKLIREKVSLPLLMKDFIISPVQIDAASKLGADVILLIQALFDRNYCDADIDELISYAHSSHLEILLETHTEEEYEKAVDSDADLVGINNRDLKTLTVDLRTTEKILRKHTYDKRIIVSESGIVTSPHIRYLRNSGANAFLVGTAVMKSSNIEGKIRELREA